MSHDESGLGRKGTYSVLNLVAFVRGMLPHSEIQHKQLRLTSYSVFFGD